MIPLLAYFLLTPLYVPGQVSYRRSAVFPAARNMNVPVGSRIRA